MTTNPYTSITDAQYHDLAHAAYTKSSVSNANGGCITLAALGDMIGLQDDKLPEDTRPDYTLMFTRQELAAFIRGAKDGEFDNLL